MWIRLGRLSGRVLSQVSSDVCMGEGLQIEGGALSRMLSSEVSSHV